MKLIYYSQDKAWQNFTPQDLIFSANPKGRGRELGLLHNLLTMATLGNQVAFYSLQSLEQEFKNVIFRNCDNLYADLEKEHDPVDVVVAWSSAHILGESFLDGKVKLRIAGEMTLDQKIGLTEQKIDFHLCQSRFHRDTLLEWDEGLDPEKVVVCPTIGAALSEYKELKNLPKKVDKFVWNSSPDRGLFHILRIWPLIKKDYPNASFDIFYGFDELFEGVKWGSDYLSEMMWFCKENLNQDGITLRGARPRAEVLKELAQCEVFFYPMEPLRWSENLCLAVQEAMCAGCAVVTSDADAIGELYCNHSLQIPQQLLWNDEYLYGELKAVIENETIKENLVRKGNELMEQVNIAQVCGNMIYAFREMIKEKENACNN